jgi:hypothetical protein
MFGTGLSRSSDRESTMPSTTSSSWMVGMYWRQIGSSGGLDQVHHRRRDPELEVVDGLIEPGVQLGREPARSERSASAWMLVIERLFEQLLPRTHDVLL